MPLATNDPALAVAARSGGIVAMVGAGVSAAAPSSLPGWEPLNSAIRGALATRLGAFLNGEAWLRERIAFIEQAPAGRRFPPEYQAQLIEEMCGVRYFEALQALDVTAFNRAHAAIAALAGAGAVRAIVTTNFDRLIERALEACGVPHVVARDAAEFQAMQEGEALAGSPSRPVPVIKIHGCVSDARSMIDTLKQRKLGRAPALQACLDRLHDARWLYVGFSAADLEGDPGYLGLVAGARRSPGATYVLFPGRPPVDEPRLGAGAELLMQAYGTRGHVVVDAADEVLARLCGALGLDAPIEAPTPETGSAQVRARLAAWAASLSPAAAGVCLGALLEAAGDAGGAARLLDRLVRHELLGPDDREHPDYPLVQLHYGRLGAAFGRFAAVPDLNGAESNASVESLQSLLRLAAGLGGARWVFAGASWAAPALLWRGDGAAAQQQAAMVMTAFLTGGWPGAAPASHEEAVDAWTAAASVLLANEHAHAAAVVRATAAAAERRALECGDWVRAARVSAWRILASAQTTEDVPAMLAPTPQVAEATRVGDGLTLGLRALALGRWLVGAGGLARATDDETRRDVARRALAQLNEAVGIFERQTLDAWLTYALVQAAKAWADLHEFATAEKLLEEATGARRFPVWSAHVWEARSQLATMRGHSEDAAAALERAIEEAGRAGLGWKQEVLIRYATQLGYEVSAPA